jgi:RNA polymerase sigma factor (sigma-70 family)
MNKKESEYLRFIAENDYQGINAIYAEYLPLIKNLIIRNGGTLEDALDVFQDAIIIIYEKMNKGGFTLKSKFYTLLYGICRNLWGNRLQKKAFQEVTLDENAKYIKDEDFSPEIIYHEEFKIFWSNFQRLGPDCKKVLKLFFEKVKMKDIQEIMGFSSLNYSKKRKFQCKEKLVKLIQQDPRYIEIMQD